MFNVQRSDFVSQLWERSKSGSIVLTGSPGIGKSWTIGQIIKRCKRENRRVVSLAAEDFDVNSIDELRHAIGFTTDIVSLLTSYGPESLFIVDGLDALRGEGSQKAFRELIQAVADQVPTSSIIASVRTFDLQQSPELQQLFFYSSGARHFLSVTTQPFSDDDLRVAAEQLPALKSVIAQNGPSEIRDLLRNPFNLRLAVELLEAGTGIEEFSSIHSQVQLLQRYWKMRVESPPHGPDRKLLLRQIVREMVNKKALSVREEAAYSPGLSDALKNLRSAEVLRESITDRISFSHNILFDYAVARLLLDEQEILNFLKADSSRIIFLRPSILYFFYHLWWNDRQVFWNVASLFFKTPNLPERAKVVPAVVVCESSRSLADVEPLILDQSVKIDGLPLTLRAIQALGTLQTSRRRLWIDVLDKIADEIHLEFINEFVSLLAIVNQSKVENENPLIGSIARRLLRWMWSTAQNLQKHQAEQLNGIAAGRVMPVVMQTYATDPSESRNIVESAVKRLGSPSASSHDAFWLAHEINYVIDNDPERALLIYQSMFSYPERSDETTIMGGSPVFTLTSTRKQDFETALYGLRQAFPHFVDSAPILAMQAAALAANAEIIERERPESDKRVRKLKFRFLNNSATYISDFSEIWDHGAREYLSLQLLDTALQRATSMSAPELRAILKTFSQYAQVAVCWKRLLEVSANNTRSFFPLIRGLLKIPQFLAAPEVAVVAGNTLRAAYGESIVSSADKDRIENAITRIPHTRFIKRYEKAESIQDRLIACIGADQLQSPELRARAEQLAQKQPTFENEPYVKITGGARGYSREDWLREQGADTSKKENAEILAAITPLTEFENKFLNSVPTTEECLAIEPHLRRLSELIQTGLGDEHICEHARGVLYGAAESVTKNHELGRDLAITQFCRTLLIQGASDPSPVFDPKYHLNFDMPSWGSPLPRIEAAQGVSHLLWNYGSDDDELVKAFVKLTGDQVPAVRYQVAVGLIAFFKHKDEHRFWEIVSEMMSAETTPGVMLGLLETLGRVANSDPDRVVEQLTKTIDRGLPATDRSELTRSLVQILTGLYIVRGDQNAGQQLARFEAEPIQYAMAVSSEIFTASYYLTPNNADEGGRARARELYERILVTCYEGLQKIRAISDSKEQAEALKALMGHLDEVATRIYFSLDFSVGPTPGQAPGQALTEDQRRDLYFELKPLITALAVGTATSEEHHLLPRTAHYLLQCLNGVLRYDPGSVIKFASQICKAASALSYQFDSMAISEVVKLVEQSLADHKEILKDSSVAEALGEILDIFVRAGWPDALQLTFKLDRAVR